MPIVKPQNRSFGDKHFVMIEYGPPGLGKTTLALSAEKPLLVDFERGSTRVRADHVKDTLELAKYQEFLDTLNDPAAMRDYESIIIDTGGAMISMMSAWAIKRNSSNGRKTGGGLSMQGFGTIKNEFQRVSEQIRTTLNKNLIYVFHSEEKNDGDVTKVRLLCEGSAKNIVWNSADFGGYLVMEGGKRRIYFQPGDNFFAKRCYGIKPYYDLPDLTDRSVRNTFLTDLFAEARRNIQAEADAVAEQRKKYEGAMAQGHDIIAAVTDADTAASGLDAIKKIENALTSQAEIRSAFSDKLKALGLKWDAASQTFVTKAKE